MSEEKLIEVFTKIFASYNLFLLISSCVLNPIVIFIIIKSKRLRSTSTFKILAFSAVNDILTCFAWNLEGFTDSFFAFQPYSLSLLYCRLISNFLQLTSLQLESWLVVSISLERLMSLSYKKWSTHYFKGHRPIIYCFLLTLVLIGINFNEIFTIGYSDYANGTVYVTCFMNRPGELDFYQLMAKVSHLIMFHKIK